VGEQGLRSGKFANYQNVMVVKSWAHRSWCVNISDVESSPEQIEEGSDYWVSGIIALDFPFTPVRRPHPDRSINQSVTPERAQPSARDWPEKIFPIEPDRAWSMLLANSCLESLRLSIVQKTRMVSL
jgi:hypothetical protein